MTLPILDTDILNLIPQRAPIVMVSALYKADDTQAETGLTILEDNMFLEDNHLRTPGIIEHIAQSAAAYLGYQTLLHKETIKLGYIGEVKRCEIGTHPEVGQELLTHLTLLAEVDGVRLIQAETTCQNQIVCTCQMKLFLKEN